MFQSPYEAIGGEQVVSKLVDAFYERVAKHPDLAPIFPKDLTETARKQKQFLTQYLGGFTALYSRTRTPDVARSPLAVSNYTNARKSMACVYA